MISAQFKHHTSHDALAYTVNYAITHKELREQAIYLLRAVLYALNELSRIDANVSTQLVAGSQYLEIDSIVKMANDARLSNHAIVDLRHYLMKLPGDGSWIDYHLIPVCEHAAEYHQRAVKYIHDHFIIDESRKTESDNNIFSI